MSSPLLTRRALLAGAGTTVASAAIAVPYVNAARSEEVCSTPCQTGNEVVTSGQYPPVLHTLAGVQVLIQSHQAAYSLYDEMMDAMDQGQATDAQVDDALEQVNDALEAICRARPINSQAADLRRDYVSGRLFAHTDSCPALIQCMYEAFLA